jgi:hypothetical protein
MAGTIEASEFIKAYEAEPEETFEDHKKGPSPFDFIKAINTKKDLVKDDSENIKHYLPFIINRGFSYFPDTVLYANELNMYPEIPVESQYYYYMSAIRKGNRFSKWHKLEKDSDLILIQKIYNVRPEIAKQYRKLISDDDMQMLHKLSETGETVSKKKKNK